MADITAIIAAAAGVGTLVSPIFTIFIAFWEPDDHEKRKKWKEKGRKIVIGVGIFLTIVFLVLVIVSFYKDASIPLDIDVSVQYEAEGPVAVVTLKDGPKWAAGVYCTVGEADEVPCEGPVFIYENTEITVRKKILWFLEISSDTRTIDMLPVYNITMSEEAWGIFSLEISAPKEYSNLEAQLPALLESALSVPENGYIDFTQTDIAASGIGGAQFTAARANDDIQILRCFNRAKQYDAPQTEGVPLESASQAIASGAPDPDAGVPSPAGEVISLSGLSSGGYLTMRVPLDQSGTNSVDIVVNKGDLSDRLQQNGSIIIETFYSEQTLFVSVKTRVGAFCKLDHGLLLELYGPGHKIGSYAEWENGDIIQKSVARGQASSLPEGNTGPNSRPSVSDGQGALFSEEPPPQDDFSQLSGDSSQEGSCSLIIPVKPFRGSARLQIIDDVDGSTYTDVLPYDLDAAAYASGHGLMTGYDDWSQTFGPGNSAAYGEVVTVLFRLEGSPDSKSSSSEKEWFSGKWFAEGAQWALASGIVASDDSAGFQSDPYPKQVQCLRMVWQLARGGVSDEEVSDSDIQIWAIKNRIISADASNPGGTVSRIQLARIIRNYCIADADWKKAV